MVCVANDAICANLSTTFSKPCRARYLSYSASSDRIVQQYSAIRGQGSKGIFLSLRPEWLSDHLPSKLGIFGCLILKHIDMLEKDGSHLLNDTVSHFSVHVIENDVVLQGLITSAMGITSNSKLRIP